MMYTNIKCTTINDRPENSTATVKNDLLGLELYQKALVKFIKKASTPVTIAIQGEWGSGKSSLMYYLKNELCDEGEFIPVWINSWEYALFNDDIGALSHIVSDIIRELTENLPKEFDVSVIKDLLKKISMTSLYLAGKDFKIIDAIFKNDSKKEVDSSGVDSLITVSKLRESLSKVIEARLEASTKKDKKSRKEGFVFFIDDLDRIEPTVAVKILEIFKNIFDIDNCIFVIAIDYDVVIKGLKPKYGEMTDSNEREFRSFFDKIIQVPFTMPLSEYKIENYLSESLKGIDYFNTEKDINTVITMLSKYILLSVGTNPRSIKRLVNLLSLIRIITDAKENQNNRTSYDKNKRVILFGIVCLQLAYPKISELLREQASLNKWDLKFAQKMNIQWFKDEEESLFAKSFDESIDELQSWHKVLYLVCREDVYLRIHFLDIVEFLNSLMEDASEFVKDLKKEEKVSLEEYLNSILILTTVTEVTAKKEASTELMKIGAQVKAFFYEKIDNTQMTENTLDSLMKKDVSKDLLGIGYALLVESRVGVEKRYYKKPITINGKQFYFCSQWYASNKDAFEQFRAIVEEKLDKGKTIDLF